jgi:cytochrome c oxidase subunit 1
MVLMSMSMHIAGLLGSPRRTADVSYFGAAGAQSWHGEMVTAALGGTLLFVSILMFVWVALATALRDLPDAEPEPFRFAPVADEAMTAPAIFDRLPTWGALAIGLAFLAYAGPIYDQVSQPHFLAPGMRTW